MLVNSILGVLPALLTLSKEVMGQEQQPILYSGNATTNGCEQACTTLANLLGEGNKLFYQTYNKSLTSYYSARHASVPPLCLAQPHSAEDVSTVMKVIAQHSCPFAAKSGGHGMFPGSSSAPNGVTIDLKLLNQVEIVDDERTVRVGPGNLWSAVYEVLDKKNLTVVGGRSGTVGVGGYLLSGGIAYASRKYGWGADNVRNFEVVLANGSISDINYISHPDLYWALRGGGAGFGIVTRFDLEIHPLTSVWGDLTASFVGDLTSRAAALSSFRTASDVGSWIRFTIVPILTRIGCVFGFCTTIDEHATHLWNTLEATKDDPETQVYGYLGVGAWLNTAGFHMTNFGGHPDVVAFREMREGKKLRSVARVEQGLQTFADELSGISDGFGKRASFSTLSFKNPDLALIKKLYAIYIEESEPLQSLGGGFWSTNDDILISLPMMFIAKDDVIHMAKNGGNPLGINPEDCPLLIFCLTLGWPHEKDDDAFLGAEKRIIERFKAVASENDQLHRFIYQNYASSWQDVFAGYGEENRAKLRSIQKKYDPEDLFQRLQSGHFKV